MIRKCPVLLNNDHVTVVRFDDVDVQLPAIGVDEKYVNVLYENGIYEIVAEAAESTEIVESEKPQQKSKKKKTTKQENVETVAVNEEA